jgi:hypothetical protein
VQAPRLSFPIPLRAITRAYRTEQEPCTNDPKCDPPWHPRTRSSAVLADGAVTELKPGDVYLAESHKDKWACAWSNCDGRHLHVVLPVDGGLHDWDVDGRASNCELKDEGEHRCWIRHGSAEAGTLHVDKAAPNPSKTGGPGSTCKAGAGSIAVAGNPGFHGYVRQGKLVLA